MYIFNGISSWLDYKLRNVLAENNVDHVLESSEICARKLETVPCDDNTVLLKLDVAKFFICGLKEQLIMDALHFVQDRKLRELMREVLDFVLENQWVRSDVMKNKSFKSILGTGMGIKHSGTLATVCFWSRCEKEFACDRSLWEYYGIRDYMRYHDDILIPIQNCSLKIQEFVEKITKMADYYVLEVEEIGRCVRYLDLSVKVMGSRILCAPTFKETSLLVPLSYSSMHPRQIHDFWPIACIKRMYSKSSVFQDAESAKETFIQRFVDFGAPEHLIRRMRMTTNAYMKKNDKDNKEGDTIWLPLPYHWAWEKRIKSEVDNFCKSDSRMSLLNLSFSNSLRSVAKPQVRICWKNSTPNLMKRTSSAASIRN